MARGGSVARSAILSSVWDPRYGAQGRRAAVAAVASAVVIIVAGQSNSRKANTQALTGPSRYANLAVPATVKIWNPVAAAWVDYTTTNASTRTCGSRAGSDATPDRAWGTEAEFIYWMRANGDNRPVYIVKQSVNGTSMATDWLPTSGGQWTNLKGQTDACLPALRAAGTVEEVVLWNQGEADANDATSTTNFASNFNTFMTNFRSSISASAKFIAERLRPLGYGTGAIANSVAAIQRTYDVREAQIARLISDGNFAAVSTEWYPTNWTDLHPSQTYSDPTSGTIDTWIAGLQTPTGDPKVDDGIGKRAYAAWKGTHDATYGSLTSTIPASFTFIDNTGAAASSSIASNTITPVLGRRAAISVSGDASAQYQITNWDDSVAVAWTSTSGNIDPGQKVQVRVTSSGTAGTAVNATLTIGGVSDTFTATTSSWSPTNSETTDFMAAVAVENGGSNPFTLTEKQAIDAFYTTAKGSTPFLSLIKSLYVGGLNPVAAAKVDMVRPGTSAASYSDRSRFTQSGGSGMPSWTDNAGWSNGASSGFGASMNAAPGSLTSQDSIGVGGYFKTRQSSSNSIPDIIDEQSVAANIRIQLIVFDAGSTTTANIRLNSAAAANITGLADTDGFYHANRSGSTAVQLYGPAGTSIATQSTASVTPTSTGVYFGRASSGLTTNAVLGAQWLTTSMSSSQVQAFRDALVTLLTAFGAN